MTEGDPEPPHLYSSAVLHAAKTESTKANYIHIDTLTALVILKATILNNVIHNFGLDPIFIHYWTIHQLNIYKRYSVENNACIFVDATGSVIKKKLMDRFLIVCFYITALLTLKMDSFQYAK